MLTTDLSHESLELNKHRYNIRTLLQYSNATPIRTHIVGSGYICCFCKAHYPKAADLKTHTICDHDNETKNKFMQRTFLSKYMVKLDITSLQCSICSALTDTLDKLIDHLNNIHHKGLHKDIKSHIVCFKLDGDIIKCHVCSVEYNSFKKLQEHMNKHFSNYICAICGAGFINRKQLLPHADMHKEGEHKCSTCDKVFQSAKKLKYHERVTHLSVTGLYKCYQCGKKFKNNKAKRDHMKETHGVEFAEVKCEACDRTFSGTHALRVHKNKDHLMERRFQCGLCDARFFTSTLLKNHNITHTGLRDFKCELCTKSYSRKAGLREHMRSHTGDRRFKCNYCSMAFLQKCSLKGHLRSRHENK